LEQKAGLLELRVGFGNVFAGDGVELAADNVGGETGAEEARVNGSHFLFVEFASEGTQFAFDALAHHRALIGGLGSFVQRRFDVPVRNPTPPQVARNPEFTLLARFGPLPRELLRIPRVIDQAVFCWCKWLWRALKKTA